MQQHITNQQARRTLGNLSATAMSGVAAAGRPDLTHRAEKWLAAMQDGAAAPCPFSDDELLLILDANGCTGQFRQRALLELAHTAPGDVLTYGELAARAGRPQAARAAGTACATNPMPLIIPCHRIVPAGGGVGTYSGIGGSPLKHWLITYEARAAGEATRGGGDAEAEAAVASAGLRARVLA